MQLTEIKTDRILLLGAIVLYNIWGAFFVLTNPLNYDPLWERLFFSAYLLAIFLITFLQEENRKLLDFLLYSAIYIAIFRQAYLLYCNDLSYEYFIAFIVIIISVIIYFKTNLQLLCFAGASVLSLGCVFVFKYDAHKFLFYNIITLTILFFLTLIFLVKSSNLKKVLDISEKLKKSEEEYRVLMESAPDVTLTLDQDEKIVHINPKGLDLFGFSMEEMIGKSIENFIPAMPFRIASYKEEDRDLESHKIYFIQSKSEEKIPVEININAVNASIEYFNYIVSIRDVSERIRQERELSVVKNQLKEKELTDKISRAKSDFISKMSHEIRTPLNGIYGFSEVLLKENLTNEQQKYVKNIRFSSGLLKSLIEDILDNANLESDKITLNQKPFKIKPLIDNLLENFSLSLEEKHLQIRTQYDKEAAKLLFVGDANRISQIIMNLISNAIKFSFQHTVIEVKIAAQMFSDTGAKLRVAVINEGVKIPEDRKDEIFQPFLQIENEFSASNKGTGLGLSIVSYLVDLMEGALSVEVNDKTSFSFELPLQITDQVQDESRLNLKELNFSSERILIVEDNTINQFLLRAILDKYNLSYDLAANGLEAVEAVKQIKFDLILMDIMMPEMDGLEATNIIRGELQVTTPIFALTADAKIRNVEKNRKLFNEYIKKPFEEEELLFLLNKYLNQKA